MGKAIRIHLTTSGLLPGTDSPTYLSPFGSHNMQLSILLLPQYWLYNAANVEIHIAATHLRTMPPQVDIFYHHYFA